MKIVPIRFAGFLGRLLKAIMAGSMERAASTITSEFDPEAFFVGIFLKGHQTREDYFCLGKDSIQKFKDNNIFNLQRATNLTEEQLFQDYGVPRSKCKALVFELSRACGCGARPAISTSCRYRRSEP